MGVRRSGLRTPLLPLVVKWLEAYHSLIAKMINQRIQKDLSDSKIFCILSAGYILLLSYFLSWIPVRILWKSTSDDGLKYINSKCAYSFFIILETWFLIVYRGMTHLYKASRLLNGVSTLSCLSWKLVLCSVRNFLVSRRFFLFNLLFALSLFHSLCPRWWCPFKFYFYHFQILMGSGNKTYLINPRCLIKLWCKINGRFLGKKLK